MTGPISPPSYRKSLFPKDAAPIFTRRRVLTTYGEARQLDYFKLERLTHLQRITVYGASRSASTQTKPTGTYILVSTSRRRRRGTFADGFMDMAEQFSARIPLASHGSHPRAVFCSHCSTCWHGVMKHVYEGASPRWKPNRRRDSYLASESWLVGNARE